MSQLFKVVMTNEKSKYSLVLVGLLVVVFVAMLVLVLMGMLMFVVVCMFVFVHQHSEENHNISS